MFKAGDIIEWPPGSGRFWQIGKIFRPAPEKDELAVFRAMLTKCYTDDEIRELERDR